MKLTAQEHPEKVLVLELEGRLDVASAPEIRSLTQEKMADGVLNYVADLRAIDFLDSAGLASLVNLLKNARREGGNVRLIMPVAEAAKRTIILTRFDKVFDIFETVEEAVQF